MAKERGYSPLFILVAIIAVVAALALAKEILLPIALAMLLSFLLTPLANRLERWRVPRVLAVILVVAMAFAPLVVVGLIAYKQIGALSRALPAYRESIVRNVTEKIRSIRPSSDTLNTVSETIEDVSKRLTEDVETDEHAAEEKSETSSVKSNERESQSDATDKVPAPNDAEDIAITAPADDDPNAAFAEGERVGTQDLGNKVVKADGDAVPVTVVNEESLLVQIGDWLFRSAAAMTATAGLVIVLVFFLLLDRESQRNRLIQLFGRSRLHTTTEAFHEAAQRVGRYLRMLFLINTGYGVVVTLGLGLIGVPSAITWGVLGFMLRFLPYVGPWLAACLPLAVSFATTEGWSQPLLVMGMYIVYELILNNVAEPLLYGNSVGVSTVGVVLSAIFWTWLWGPVGLILAMPMTVCLVVLAQYVPQLRFITVLLADQQPLSPSERVYQRLLAFDYNEPLTVAQTHLKSSTLAGFYDEVLVPALVLAEQDRHAGLLNEDQEEFVQEAAADLVEQLSDAAVAVDAADADASTVRGPSADEKSAADDAIARVLCIPLRDEADETTAKMLSQLLRAEGFIVETEASESLTGELVDRVAKTASDLVVISILPPISPRDSRLLWKRLRSRYPDLPIVVGFWGAGADQELLAPPEEDRGTKVATTLAEAVTLVRTAAAQVTLVDKDVSHETRTAG
jgi:predicted PurR-regulated permease PerM